MPKAHSSGFQTHAPTLQEHAGRTEDRASQLHQHADSVGGTSMPGNALGSIGSSHASTLTSHYQHAGTAVHGAGDHLSDIATTERTNASNYTQADEDNAARFSSITNDATSKLHHPTTVSSDSNPNQSMPGLGGGHSSIGHTAPTSTTPQSAPAPTAAPPPPVRPLSGTGPGGKIIPFAPGDVQSIPLHDSSGKLIGVSFPTKPDDPTKVPAWASAPNRTSDSQYVSATPKPPAAGPSTPAGAPYPPRPSGSGAPSGSGGGAVRPTRPPRPAPPPKPGYTYSKPQATPWANSGGTPTYVHAHANPNAFAVNVNTGTAAAPVWTKVRVDGTTHGQIIAGNQHYQQATGANPNSPLVMMSCNSARPGGTAASGAAAYLHSSGNAGDIYAPTGTGLRLGYGPTKSGYGVNETVDAGGNTVPGSFQHFPPPPPAPPTPPAPAQPAPAPSTGQTP